MSEQRSILQRSPRSLAEEQVLRGLEQLPPGYEVLMGSRLQIPEVPGGESLISYEPDFEVCRPDGSRVVIEVKTGKSLSMVNLSRFVKFNELINAAGKNFLVLVWGNDHFPDRLSVMPEFETLHIEAVDSDSDVVQAVQGEFRK
ncbi:hypothetical protein [Duganella sp. BuS-21]|uniref:hypothetical protein n=1 Tax=Duganella sp. BuS-21 TaxID=2943848 RepID=UPI0035A5A6EE